MKTKQLIWTYVLLLVFEGALRKWIFPSISMFLLLIRDPIAIILIIKYIRRKEFNKKAYLVILICVVIASLILTLIFGHGNFAVGLYGARIYLIHVPVIFIIGDVFTRTDVIKVGRFLQTMLIPMTILMIVQFYSPQTAWVNRGIGGEGTSSGFGGALGYFRPSGLFSFTNGLILYYSLTFTFLLCEWIELERKKILLLTLTIFYILSIPYSISRTLLFQTSLSIIFFLIATAVGGKGLKYLGTVLLLGVTSIIMIKISSGTEGLNAFEARLTQANTTEGGLDGVFIDRFLGGMVNAVIESNSIGLFGKGIGLGTNVGSKLVSGDMKFLVAEAEWGRIIGEMGIILGGMVILYRLYLGNILIINSYKMLNQTSLPWLLASVVYVNILQAQWAQPTSLGFSVLGGGLLLASLKNK